MTNEWINSEYFPIGDGACPPLEAVAESCEIYRFGLKNTICAEDFRPMTSESRFRNKYQDNFRILCQGSGLSSYCTLEDSIVNFNRINKNAPGSKRKFKSISKIRISDEDGVLLKTPSKNSKNHLTWWGYKNKIDLYILNSQILHNYNAGGD